MVWQGENFGWAIKSVAKAIEPGRPALLHADRTISWEEFDAVTDAIAVGLAEQGLKPGDVVGQMLRNAPEYLIAFFGCVKAGITPVNVNYRYKRREMGDIFARFDLKALFVEPDLAEDAAASMPPAALAPFVAQPGDPRWEALCATPVPADFTPCKDPDRQFYMATGGTTGMPKAVVWPFRDAWLTFNMSSWPVDPALPPHACTSLDEHLGFVKKNTLDSPESTSPVLCLCPLMHGTAQFAALGTLLKGGTVATMPGTHFDANAAIDAIRDHRIRMVLIVGDAFAIPMVEALESRSDAAEAISSLKSVTSSGAIFSMSLKKRFLAINPEMMINDVLGSSEAGGSAVRITTKDGTLGGGDFVPAPGRELVLIDKDFNLILPGEEGVGIVARTGPLPLGYLGEDAKNAETFPIINGKRYLLTGDHARWGAGGTLEFFGRDNMCINTGGEKVFPEEIEAVLLEHRDVHDVRVVSLPDPRFGRKIVAVVQPEREDAGLEDALDAYVRDSLATYKAPKLYIFTRDSLRLNNGKPDYSAAQAIADAHAG